MQAIRVIKSIVLIMSLMIVALLVVLGYALYNRAQDRAAEQAALPEARTAATIVETAEGSFESRIDLPPGSRIIETVIGDNRLILRVETPEDQRLLILRSGSGTVMGTIILQPGQ